MVRLICSGSSRHFIRAISFGLKQIIHDISNNGIFALLFVGLTIWNMNANPVFDLGTLKTHLERGTMIFKDERGKEHMTYVRKLANNTSAANFDGRRLVGGPGCIATVTRTTSWAATDSIVTTRDADHLKGRELSPTLANEKRIALCL